MTSIGALASASPLGRNGISLIGRGSSAASPTHGTSSFHSTIQASRTR